MKLHPKRVLAGVSALAVTGGVLLATAGTAFAVAPGWEPDPNSVGSITFTDATGAPITGGSINSPMSAYVIASLAGRTGDTKATLFGASPVQGENSLLWGSEKMSASTTYNPSGTIPADLAGTGLPVVSAPGESMATLMADEPNTSTVAGYQNLWEIRLYTSGTQSPASTYDSADVLVDPTAQTWTLVYPAPTDATTTTITETPPSPDVTSANPVSVTLNASVSAAAPGVPSSYTGPIGAVQFFDGATQVGATQLVTGTGPYVASVIDSITTNPSSHTFKAVFSAFSGSTLIGSQSAPSTWTVGPPLPNSTTTLSAGWQPFAGGSTPTAFNGTVTGAAPSPPLTAGVVFLYANGSTTPLNATGLTPGAGGAYSFNFTFPSPGPESVVATFTDPGVYNPSSSAPVTQNLGQNPNAECKTNPVSTSDPLASCNDTQTITGTVPVGTLSVSTPYTATQPFNVGTLALDGTGTILTAHAVFGGAGLDPTNANADIIVTDTRAGDLNWTLQAIAANLTDATSDVINGQNVGLTGLGSHPAPGFNTAGLVGFDNPAANGVAPADPGHLGLGGIKHDVAQATHGIGTVGIYGTLTLNAPTSTPAGTYTGTLTFTIVGSLV